MSNMDSLYGMDISSELKLTDGHSSKSNSYEKIPLYSIGTMLIPFSSIVGRFLWNKKYDTKLAWYLLMYFIMISIART